MSKTNVIGAVSGAVAKVGGKALLKCKTFSPEIMLVGGIVVGVAAIVSACCATRHLDEVSDDVHKDLDDIQEVVDQKTKDCPEEEKKEIVRQYKKDFFKAYVRAGGKYLRLYALPVGLTVVSVGLILGSHGVLKTRYLNTVAAYTAMDEAFRDYRKRIRDIAGEESEARFYNGTDEIELTRINEDGDTVKETVQKQILEKKDSPYEFDFNKYTAPLDATTNSAHNFHTIRQIQSWANDRLNSVGHIFLNEVLDGLGLQRTPAGAVVGWLKHGNGDGYVDFGAVEYYNDDVSDIIDGNIPNIHLNFNCDGIIFNKI